MWFHLIERPSDFENLPVCVIKPTKAPLNSRFARILKSQGQSVPNCFGLAYIELDFFLGSQSIKV